MGNMLLVRNPLTWILRFRKRRGYGVHSPWAFALIDGVILERQSYYAYSSLNRLHPWFVRALKTYSLQCRRLLFRLANWVHPSSVVIIGDAPIETAYIHAAVAAAPIHKSMSLCPPQAADGSQTAIPPHEAAERCLVFVSSPNLLSYDITPCALCILEGIHSSHKSSAKWRAIQSDPRVGVTFDLYTYGLVFFDLTRHKQHYVVNF
ncbi:MAG: hypothetical protein K6F94_00585 [Bacteroidaceae bacterium]|nr:hypothetical protein [Bacteroidaceae bacterium]